MIAEMLKINLVVRQADRERLLDKLADMGVIHIQPVDPARAIADEKLTAQMEKVNKALQTISACEAAGDKPQLEIEAAIEEIVSLQRAEAERDSRLNALYRLLDQQKIWEGVHRADLQTIADAVSTSLFTWPLPVRSPNLKQTGSSHLTNSAQKP